MSEEPEVTQGANTELFPASSGEGSPPRWRRRVVIGLAALVGLLALGVAGISYAGYSYGQRYEGRILPGATIAGNDVGGMSYEQALREVRRSVGPQLNRTIEIRWRTKTWEVTPRELGARSNAVSAVKAVFRASEAAGFMDHVKMGVLGDELGVTKGVAITYPRQGAKGFIQGIASSLAEEPVDATLDYSTGWVQISPSEKGRAVLVEESRRALHAAMRKGMSRVALSVKVLEPEVTEDSFDQVLLVRSGENKLYLYQDGDITHSWPVAPGLPEYRTPTGLYEVTEKRYMPTWINPSPDTWGADLPAEIPPGPGNPLGLRAINWSAPAIRFHGTTATYSLGYNASHGCVRMSNPDVIELYDLIDVGTPIVSLEVAPLKPLRPEKPRVTDPARVQPDGTEPGGTDTGRAGNKEQDRKGD